MGVDASRWIDAETRQNIQSGAQGDSIAEHASVIWQEFDVAMIMPEPYYDQRQYWFKMDTYAMPQTIPDTLPEKHSSVLDAEGRRLKKHSAKPVSSAMEMDTLEHA